MEIGWLEDFLAVAEEKGFARAAENLGVNQPALSRHIRALEDWLKAPLFDRSTHRLTLTPAGEAFQPVAEEIVRRLRAGRDEARAIAAGVSETLRFASTHGLALSFFPRWLKWMERQHPLSVPVQLTSDHMQNCERLFVRGDAHFLLCHHHAAAENRLGPSQFKSVLVGTDVLIPVSAPGPDGLPLHRVDQAAGPIALLAYTIESGVGRILSAALRHRDPAARFEPIFRSHLVTVLSAMARDGRGLAWVPASMVAEDLASGKMVRAGGEEWDVTTEIRLYRPRARQSAAAEAFWNRFAAMERAGAFFPDLGAVGS